jgi:hypothetical protein
MKEDTQKASRICQRVEVTKDPKQLQTDIEVLTARVEKEQKGSVLVLRIFVSSFCLISIQFQDKFIIFV